MSDTLAVWEGQHPATVEETVRIFEELKEQDAGGGVAPTPAIRDYVRTMLRRSPDIATDGGEHSPWADGPLPNDAAGPFFHMSLIAGEIEEALPFIVETAQEQALVCFDPQGPALLYSDEAPNQ